MNEVSIVGMTVLGNPISNFIICIDRSGEDATKIDNQVFKLIGFIPKSKLGIGGYSCVCRQHDGSESVAKPLAMPINDEMLANRKS